MPPQILGRAATGIANYKVKLERKIYKGINKRTSGNGPLTDATAQFRGVFDRMQEKEEKEKEENRKSDVQSLTLIP